MNDKAARAVLPLAAGAMAATVLASGIPDLVEQAPEDTGSIPVLKPHDKSAELVGYQAEAQDEQAEQQRARERAAKARQREEKKAAEAMKQRAAREKARVPKKKTAKPHYPNNLDGWIRHARHIMRAHGIPGSYYGIHRNALRESGGDPRAINGWDVNAQNGVPSKGLLQVIAPTFQAHHVPGTSWDPYDPVANITAACHYAWKRYGSIDNVNGAY